MASFILRLKRRIGLKRLRTPRRYQPLIIMGLVDISTAEPNGNVPVTYLLSQRGPEPIRLLADAETDDVADNVVKLIAKEAYELYSGKPFSPAQ